MINKIFSFVKKHNMINKGDTVICGLSGGADSVCLLLVLSELSRKIGFTVKALHVNHCLRGKESDRDEDFCRDLCGKLGIPFTAVSCNVRDFAEKNSLSVEESARKLRYSVFKENSQGGKIATAHNANDNLETVILNLARGSALKGLAGIPP
ncbi:MAG: tRNA lysidine(34) synthetase TilS, partial [Ruminococcus sp.]|nr:tRNA lysidine(34) synthetase TilS [Ruminococcus sp.]